MRLIVLTVLLFAMFRVNCHDLSDGGDDEASNIGQENFFGESVDLIFSTNLEKVYQMEGKPGPEQIQADKNDKDSSDEGGRVQNERKDGGGSKCKSDIVCSLLGGSCVTNATICSGREVTSVCSGANCKCCISVTLEVKVHDLETELRSMVVNLTVANSKLNTQMDEMMNFIISANLSQTISNSNLDLNIDYLSSNLTNATSDIKTEIQFIKGNMTKSNSNKDSKLDSIMENQGCPDGLFLFAPTSQCFKLLNDTTRSWYSADTACRAKGLELAQPFDAVSLRNFIISKFGTTTPWAVWIGAQGDGSYIRWKRTGKYISSSNPLWYSGRPSSSVSSSYCLAFITQEYYWKYYSKTPYYNVGCSAKYWTLCELRSE